MGRRRGNPFAFRIDYAAALRDDDRAIAWALRSIERGWYRGPHPVATTDDGVVHQVDARELWQLVVYRRDVASSLGYTTQDLADASLVSELQLERAYADLPPPRRYVEAAMRWEQILGELEILSEGGRWLYPDEAAARCDLRLLRARRARHARNQTRHG